MFVNSDCYFFLPFFDVFCAEVQCTPRSQTEFTPCLQCGNHQRRKGEPDLKSEAETLGVVGILKYCAN